MRSFVAILSLLVLLSGCAQGPSSGAGARSNHEVVRVGGAEADPSQAGEIVGRVLDDELRPLPAVSVRIQGVEARTKTTDEGIFYFANVPPRAYTLVMEKHGFESRSQAVVVSPQQRAIVEVVLVQVASQEAFMDDGFVFRGRINCSVRGNVSGTNTNPECGAGLLNAENDNLRTRKLDLLPGVTYLLVEVDWRPTVSLVNDKLTLAMRPFEAQSWRQVQGSRPIRAVVTPADFEDIAKNFEKDYPRTGGQLQFYVFPGEAVQQGGLAAGTTVQQDFTIYATAWYRMEMDPAYSRLPKD